MTQISGIYIHIPFCRQGCLYCHFVTVPDREEWIGPYVQSLVREMKLFSETGGKPVVPDSIYIGGGTPSLIPAKEIETILDACRKTFPVAENCEISMECNPDTLRPENAAIYRAAGINRISIGAQSFQQDELRAIGRNHDAGSVSNAVKMLRTVGMRNISLDILLGLPFQSLESLRATMERVAELDVEHLSVYMLDLDEPCPLSEMVEKGVVQPAGEDLVAAMYEEARQLLCGLGYRQYEISNYARGDHACRHNVKYWIADPVIGFGLGSHSFDGVSRSANLDDMRLYLEAIRSGRSPVAWRTILKENEILEERLFLGLRMNEGVDWEMLRAEYPEELLKDYESRLKRFEREGLVRWSKTRVSLTLRGMLLSNEVFRELV